MKKIILLLIFSILLLTGCAAKEELVCDIGSTVVTVTVQKGKIISYIDKIEGELSSEGIKQLNESYLESITNNVDAINKLRDVIATMGGNCR